MYVSLAAAYIFLLPSVEFLINSKCKRKQKQHAKNNYETVCVFIMRVSHKCQLDLHSDYSIPSQHIFVSLRIFKNVYFYNQQMVNFFSIFDGWLQKCSMKTVENGQNLANSNRERQSYLRTRSIFNIYTPIKMLWKSILPQWNGRILQKNLIVHFVCSIEK